MATTTPAKKPTAAPATAPAGTSAPPPLVVLDVAWAVGTLSQPVSRITVEGGKLPRRAGFIDPAVAPILAAIETRAVHLLAGDEHGARVNQLAKDLAAVKAEAILAQSDVATARAKLEAARLVPLPDAALQEKRLADLQDAVDLAAAALDALERRAVETAEASQRASRQAEDAVRAAVSAASAEHRDAVEAEVEAAKRDIAAVLAGPLARLRAAEARLVPGHDLDRLTRRLVDNPTGGK